MLPLPKYLNLNSPFPFSPFPISKIKSNQNPHPNLKIWDMHKTPLPPFNFIPKPSYSSLRKHLFGTVI